jgi:hypothetical protein
MPTGLAILVDASLPRKAPPGRNPLSSAAGYGQFLSGTWLEMFERTYPQIARTLSREQILALRDIRPLAEDLTDRDAQANAAMLRSLGLPANAGELSLAHAIGPSGAVSVLTAEPARPAAELLRPETIAANPLLREMTARSLRQWAAVRVSVPNGQSPEGGAARTQPRLETLGAADDVRIDEPKAPEAAIVNRDASALLRDLVEALSKVRRGKAVPLRPSAAAWLLSVGVEPAELLRGDPSAVRIFNKAAWRAVLDAIRHFSDRPGFAQFKAIEIHAAPRDELPSEVLRAVAIALLDKMRRENAMIAKIVRHRRDPNSVQPLGQRSGAASARDVANAGATAFPAPPL